MDKPGARLECSACGHTPSAHGDQDLGHCPGATFAIAQLVRPAFQYEPIAFDALKAAPRAADAGR